jgi:hypothetical protein
MIAQQRVGGIRAPLDVLRQFVVASPEIWMSEMFQIGLVRPAA